MKSFLTLSTIILCQCAYWSASENILVLLPVASKSHKNVFEPLISALAERNHTLTVVSPVKPSKIRKNVREIVPGNTDMLSSQFGNPFKMREQGRAAMMTSSFQFVFDACRQTYQHPEFKPLLNEKFDLIFLDAFINDCMYGMIHKLGAPFITVVPQAAPSSVTANVGNRLPMSFVPSPMLPYSDRMSFGQRMANVLIFLIAEIMGGFVLNPKSEAVYKKELGEDLPGVEEMAKNVSMIFSNSHFVLTFPRPFLPDVVEVGGMHCRPPKPLPKDLDEFVSGAKDGLILFSLGSIIQGKDMPDEMRDKFLKGFSRLKQRVLWKWETETMPNLPPNVKLSKWVPQQDILGHPNTKLFISHGGLLSTQEATYHGVPILGIPIFADQDLNINQAERAGYARAIEILEMTEESFTEALRDILENPKYTARAKYLSSIYSDQMETPLERAVFWSEYVMRHKGAPQLRSAARDLNFVQYYCLDVAAVLLTAVLAIIWALKFAVTGLYRCLRGSPVKVTKKQTNKIVMLTESHL